MQAMVEVIAMSDHNVNKFTDTVLTESDKLHL